MPPRNRRRPNTLRIIGGSWRGRLLHFPDADTLRPTPDRVRETLFNWLGQDLTGTRCLDLFAGSGVLGLEALSRNAGHVTFVEQSRGVCRAVAESAKSLGATDFQLHCCDALEFLHREDRRLRDSKTAGPFDIVFLDPPYGQDWIENVLQGLAPIVSPDARMYFEADQAITGLEGWAILKSAKAGRVHYGLAKREK